jgi:hypothetical protein
MDNNEEKITGEDNNVLQNQASVQESTELKEEVSIPQSITATESSSTDEADSDEHETEEHDETTDDPLTNLHLDEASKKDIYQALNQFAASTDMRLVDRAVKEIKPYFDKAYHAEKNAALESFVAGGNEEADFVYKGDEIDSSFFVLFNALRDKKHRYFSQLTKDKDQNLLRKNALLDKLRDLVDGEETNVSIEAMKAIQTEWKTIGQVPGAHASTLWANFNALLDRFYDNRSIYFELKELDRKKNLEAKLELCEKAEALAKIGNIKNAITQLNELHEEFKHIGPVPKDDQENLWERFKAASDLVYTKRKEYFDQIKEQHNHNVKVKLAIGDEVAELAKFDSDRITEWNNETKKVLELQKRWEKEGALPREKAKEVNKHFWSNFKQFFANKNEFFKKLEAERDSNLEKKRELLAKALELKESQDWNKTTRDFKQLQEDWKKIGPVPDKHRNDVYNKFKAACDDFFNTKRSQGDGQSKEFQDNLVKKLELCAKLDEYLNGDVIELDEVYAILDSYSNVGYVPKESIDKVHARFDALMESLLGLEDLTEAQRAELEIKIEVNKLKNSPHGAQKLVRKENVIKRNIEDLQNEISTYKVNIEFFAKSKTADKLKADLNDKIAKAEAEIDELKHQLKVFKNI